MECLCFHSKKILTATEKDTKFACYEGKKKIKNKVGNAEWNNIFGKWYVHTKHSLPKENTTALSAISDSGHHHPNTLKYL